MKPHRKLYPNNWRQEKTKPAFPKVSRDDGILNPVVLYLRDYCKDRRMVPVTYRVGNREVVA